jgi:hypothetical protein
VYDSMNNVHFQVGGKSFSYGNWYRGFGLSATFSMLFWAYLSWHLGGLGKVKSGGDREFGLGLFCRAGYGCGAGVSVFRFAGYGSFGGGYSYRGGGGMVGRQVIWSCPDGRKLQA